MSDVTMLLQTFGVPFAELPLPPVATAIDASATSSTVEASSVTFDWTASTMRTLAATVIDPTGTLVPSDTNQQLQPAGNEIAVWLDDTPIGVYGIVTTDLADSIDSSGGAVTANLGPVITVAGSDRSFLIAASAPSDYITIPNGTSVAAATYQLITQLVPWLADVAFFTLDDAGATIPAQTIDPGANGWATAQAWWAAIGGVLYCDPAGNIVGTIPSSTPADVYDWQRGGPTVTGFEAVFDASTAYNGVIVQATNPANIPVQAVAWDTDPASPTYYLGPFGKRPAPPIAFSTANTIMDCQQAALQLLPSYLGLSRTAQLTVLPDPTIAPYDYAQITSTPDGISGLWQVQSGQLYFDYTETEKIVAVPAGRPVGWGTAPQPGNS